MNENNHIGIRIKKRREELNMTQDELAKILGYKSRSTINKIESGINDVSHSKIDALAKALKTTPAFLLDIKQNILHIENIMEIPESEPIPLLGTIACGAPILAQENISENIYAPSFVKADFALKCKGDSMINARIYDGDIVYIKQQPTVENGQIAAVLIGDEATLKRVYLYPNKIVLNPENPLYEPLVYTNEELKQIKILGKAVYFTSQVR